MLIDLRVHTRHTTESSVDPREAVAAAQALGIDGLAFADVDTIAGRDEILGLRSKVPIALFFGVEIATDHGHLLCFFPDPEATPEPESLLGPRREAGWPVRDALKALRDAGAAVVATRPYDRRIDRPMGDVLFTLEGLLAVEALAGGLPDATNELAIHAAAHLDLPCVGGSGARRTEEVGLALTVFRDRVAGQRSLVEALRAGNVWAAWAGEPPDFPGDHQPPRKAERRERGGGRRRRGGGRR